MFYKRLFRLFPTFIIFLINLDNFVELLNSDVVLPVDVYDIDKERLKINIEEDTSQDLQKVIVIFSDRSDKGKLIERLTENADDSDVLKEELRQNVLRDAYRDACLKVVIRKCYKALMMVKKKICKSRFKCKRDFKSDFTQNARIGCLKEFDYSKKVNHNNKYNFRENKFVDATREGYLDSCIPYMATELKTIPYKNTTLLEDKDTLIRHIFRNSNSRSERKCRKLSRNKCIRACNYAKSKVCAVHSCGRSKKRAFLRSCKEECKRAYSVIRDSSESSSSDSA